jgi:hypothetical protein
MKNTARIASIIIAISIWLPHFAKKRKGIRYMEGEEAEKNTCDEWEKEEGK